MWYRLGLLLGLALAFGPALACQVCVVSSEKAPAFQEAYDSLSQELQRLGVARQDIALLGIAEYQDGGPAVLEARLLITLGTDALRHVATRNGKLLIAGLIPRISYERVLAESGRKSAAATAALYLDQPFGRQLDLMRLALPRLHRVGVLWGPESISLQPLLNTALQSRGMELSEGLYSDGQTLIGALQMALHDADGLLAVADTAIYNANTVSNILLTSYRAKVPVQAFSPAYVKAGALLSVHSTAGQIGSQLAVMAYQVLQTNNMPQSQYPVDFSVTTNDYIARSLGLTLDAKVLSDRLHRMEKRP
ncbi:ABC transporter substrate binding protein [Rhodoferax sp. GW822-FHT02A01]|uniref:ABC transporter substrate-binding protein n=1 Tax=Rhodoferax sp. GW822-FHT02A01 TaxID=3141537 RepID=UPI00315CBAD5